MSPALTFWVMTFSHTQSHDDDLVMGWWSCAITTWMWHSPPSHLMMMIFVMGWSFKHSSHILDLTMSHHHMDVILCTHGCANKQKLSTMQVVYFLLTLAQLGIILDSNWNKISNNFLTNHLVQFGEIDTACQLTTLYVIVLINHGQHVMQWGSHALSISLLEL